MINTHGHVDHTFCNKFLKEKMNLKILIHEEDKLFLSKNSINKLYDSSFEPISPDILLNDGDIIDVKTFKFSVFHTPGHTPGSIFYLQTALYFQGILFLREPLEEQILSMGMRER